MPKYLLLIYTSATGSVAELMQPRNSLQGGSKVFPVMPHKCSMADDPTRSIQKPHSPQQKPTTLSQNRNRPRSDLTNHDFTHEWEKAPTRQSSTIKSTDTRATEQRMSGEAGRDSSARQARIKIQRTLQ